jgi:hypothetical protein
VIEDPKVYEAKASERSRSWSRSSSRSRLRYLSAFIASTSSTC